MRWLFVGLLMLSRWATALAEPWRNDLAVGLDLRVGVARATQHTHGQGHQALQSWLAASGLPSMAVLSGQHTGIMNEVVPSFSQYGGYEPLGPR